MSSTEAGRNPDAVTQWTASIVRGAADAIVGVDLAGAIVSWNPGAEQLFGHAEAEMVSRSILSTVAAERHAAEMDVLTRAFRGEPMGPYETERRHKDGRTVHVSVAVSPVRNAAGEIIGASMISRDNDEARRAQEDQRMLVDEMTHRIRNLFAIASSVLELSARFARTPKDMANAVRSRLNALARAQDLTLPAFLAAAGPADNRPTLHSLIRTIVAPYDNVDHLGAERVTISGPDVPINAVTVAGLALLLHEFATNAVKYGAFSSSAGHVDVDCRMAGDELQINWREHGGPILDGPAVREGFGSMLARATVKHQLGGSIVREWNPEGLTIKLVVPLSRLSA
jgi:PAS domain S-box-containing protein